MEKISLRIEKNILHEIDAHVDYITLKNRSQAIKALLKKALGKEKVAVILSKGTDLKNQNLEKDLLISKNEYNMSAKFNNTTLIEEQIKNFKKYGFTVIYIITIYNVIQEYKKILKDTQGITIHYIQIDKSMRTADSLRLLKEKIHSTFLVIFGDLFFDADLSYTYEMQKNSNSVATLLLTSSETPSLKANVKVKGTKITYFNEKAPIKNNFIVFEPIFAADPEIFNIEGHSLVYDVFPILSKRGLLSGHLSTDYVTHLHNIKDKGRIELLLKQNK